MTRFKTEIKEKPKLTHEEEVQKMFDKRMEDVIKIFQHHENGLKVNEIYSKIRLAESYIQKVIDDGFEKTKIKLIKEYRLNGVEIMTERDEHGRFVKKSKQDESNEQKIEQKEIKIELKVAKPITSEKKTITDHIREIAKEIGPFKSVDMIKTFEVRNLSFSKASILNYLCILNINTSDKIKKRYPSIHKHAFLKKDADGKYTIV